MARIVNPTATLKVEGMARVRRLIDELEDALNGVTISISWSEGENDE